MPAPTALVRHMEGLANPTQVEPAALEQGLITLPFCPILSKSLANVLTGDDVLIDPFKPIPNDQSHIAPPDTADDDNMHIDEEGRPLFTPTADVNSSYRVESRKIPIPPHRMSPLKAAWTKIYPPLIESLKLQVRMNIKTRSVELRTSKTTTESGALQKGEDFIKAFTLG
jgi:RNA-binding protein PNO1